MSGRFFYVQDSHITHSLNETSKATIVMRNWVSLFLFFGIIRGNCIKSFLSVEYNNPEYRKIYGIVKVTPSVLERLVH